MMEHILWRNIEANRVPDIATTASEVTRLIMKAIAPNGDELRRLRQFREDVATSLKRIDQ